jgi:hypothetical protein
MVHYIYHQETSRSNTQRNHQRESISRKLQAHPATAGRHLRSGARQSMPSISIESWDELSITVPPISQVTGQWKRPCSSRLVNRQKPVPSQKTILMRLAFRPRNKKRCPSGPRFEPWCAHHPVFAKPQIGCPTANRLFLRGFPATHFSNFDLCRRSRILVMIFGASSLHPKIPFRAAGFWDAEWPRTCERNSGFWATVIRDQGRALQLFRIEAERLKLPAPFSRRIAEPLDADAAGQATFYRCFHKIRGEESQRHHHVDLPNAAFLARAKLSDRGYPT